jgi:hypothetical protein
VTISIVPNFLLNSFSVNIIMIAVDSVVNAEPMMEGPMWRIAYRDRSFRLTIISGAIEYVWLA